MNRLNRYTFEQQTVGRRLRLSEATRARLQLPDFTAPLDVHQARQVFRALDQFDHDGSARSIQVADDVGPTLAGRLYRAVLDDLVPQQRREQFVERYLHGAFDFGRLTEAQRVILESSGFDTSPRRIAGRSGCLELFRALDRLDHNGDAASIDLEGDALIALTLLRSVFVPFEQGFRTYENLDRALEQRVEAIELEVEHRAQPTPTSCFTTVVQMITDFVATARIPGPQDALTLASAEDSRGALAGWKADFAAGRAAVDRMLESGRPALVGVSHSSRGINWDRMTDHFLVIVGRTVDASGRVAYAYLDPATAGSHRRGHLYVDRETQLLFRPPLEARGFFSRGYQVSQVRPYRVD